MKKSKSKTETLQPAIELMEDLGYKDEVSFIDLIEESVKLMICTNIPYYENVFFLDTSEENKQIERIRLSPFAIYIIVMLADNRKEKVQKHQNIFNRYATKFGIKNTDFFDLQRLNIREEISDASKWLNSTASRADVSNYAAFNDAGYLGMYGSSSEHLRKLRKISKSTSIYDCMGRYEMAANLLRISLTEKKILTKNIKGQEYLKRTHYEVASEIRDLFRTQLNIYPEQLAVYRTLHDLKTKVKTGYKALLEDGK